MLQVGLKLMSRALVLNITDEPLSIVSGQRAALLAYEGKADIVEFDGEVIRSEMLSLTVPTVVRLRYYVHISYERKCSISRRGVFARDNHLCQYCGCRADSIDHVTPKSRGGKHTWENVVAACRACNSRKRDRLPSEIGLHLRRRPTAPNRMSWVLSFANDVPHIWRPYLRTEMRRAS